MMFITNYLTLFSLIKNSRLKLLIIIGGINILKHALVFLTIFIGLFGPGSKIAFAADNQVTIEAEGNVNYDLESHITTATGHVKVTHEKGFIIADELTYNSIDGFLEAVGSVKASSNEGLVIGADRLTYDRNTGTAEFNKHVKLTSNDDLTITAEHLTYNETTGLAIASGGVEITQKQSTYQTAELVYNHQTGQGSSGGSVSCFIGNNSGGRGIKLNGETMEIADEVTTLKKNVFTRCQRPKPEYNITATKIAYDGDRVKLWNAIVFLHGVPFFYLPYLSYRVGADHLLDLEPGYNSDDGFYITYSYDAPVENGRNWFINGVYKTKDTSTYGAGFRIYKNNLSNRITVKFNDPISGDDYWSVSDTVSYNMPLFSLSASGSRQFNTSEETHYNLRLTGKRQNSPLGSWRAGILAEKITAVYRSNKYGGIYAGCRLDYYPNQYLTFSLLKIDPQSTLPGRGFETLLSDYNYRFGSNWLYNIRAPLGKDFSFAMDGSYNSSQDLWIDRNYKIVRKTCCFSLSLGWDDIEKAHTFSWSIRL